MKVQADAFRKQYFNIHSVYLVILMTFKKQFDLTGKVSVVTGGCGILGKRFCAGLAEFGSNIAVIDVDEQEASNYAREIAAKYNVKSAGVGCDVSNQKSVKSMVVKVEKGWEKLIFFTIMPPIIQKWKMV